MFSTDNVVLMNMLTYCVAGKDEYRESLKGIIFLNGHLVASNGHHLMIAKMDYPSFLEDLSVTLPKLNSSVKRIIIEDEGSSLSITYFDKKGASKTILEKKRENTLLWSSVDMVINAEEKHNSEQTIGYNWSYLAGLQKAMGNKNGFAVTLYEENLIVEGEIDDVEWKYKLAGLNM